MLERIPRRFCVVCPEVQVGDQPQDHLTEADHHVHRDGQVRLTGVGSSETQRTAEPLAVIFGS